MKINLILCSLVFLLLWSSCDDRQVVSVTRVGELEELVRNGDLSTHAKLKNYEHDPYLFGLGIVTNNEGYITILDGKSYTSSVDSNKNVVIDSSFNAEATLFLYSRVISWKPYEIPPEVTTWKQLEQFISNTATKFNVSKTDAFCFELKGTAAELSWQVLNWRTNIKEITYKKLLSLGATGILTNEPVEAIGFYSKDPKEIFVHQESVLNIHFVNHDHSLAGRIDDLKLDGRMKLYLPEQSPK